MQLRLENGMVYDDPSPELIKQALWGLNNEFANFLLNEMTYVSASGSPETGFWVEYQIDFLDNHFSSVPEYIPFDKVFAIFLLFAQGSPVFKDIITWKYDSRG